MNFFYWIKRIYHKLISSKTSHVDTKNIAFIDHCKVLCRDVQDLVFVTDTHGNIKFINENAKKMLGYEISQKYQDFMVEHYSAYIKDIFDKAIKDDKWSYPFLEFPIKNSLGNYIWFRMNMSLKELNNELLIIGTAKDVNQTRNLQHQIELTNLWSTFLINNLKSGFLVEDQNRNVLFINKAFIDIFEMDFEPENLIGINFTTIVAKIKDKFVFPDDFVNDVNANIAHKENVNSKLLILKNGKILERDCFSVFNYNGQCNNIWKYQDITKEHKLTEQKKQSEEKYRSIIENMQLGIIEVDTSFRITNVYDQFCNMLGYDREDLIGRKPQDVFLTDEYYSFFEIRRAKRDKGKSSVYEIPLLKKDGTMIWATILGTPVYNDQNELTGSIAVVYNITEGKNLEQELKRANKATAIAQESEKLFLASMTHEIKTPLNTIIGMGDLLKLTNLNDEQKDYVSILDTSTKFLQKLVSDILDISKIELGTIQLNRHSFNLKNVLSEIARTFEYSLPKKNLELKLDFDFELNNQIFGDSMILQQIIVNLLSNAEKFTEKGIITLKVNQLSETSQTIKVRFCVEDTGIGFNEAQKGVIFNKFKQLPSLSQHKSQGTGLGLSIVKQLVELNGGKIEVESEEGKGSSFSFELVFEKSIEVDNTIDKPYKHETGKLFRDLKVLVVEDNELNQQYIERVLQKWSIEFEIARSGEEAIEKFADNHFDLVLLDLQLPGIDGFQTAVKLRTNYQDQVYVIIAMTAVVFPEIEREVIKFGMDDILKKPFTISELYEKIIFYFSEISESNTIDGKLPFCEELDNDFLNQFYGEDGTYALGVFEKFKSIYLKEFEQIVANNDKKTLDNVKRKLHDIKPSFKMVGLSDIEEKIDGFIKQDKAEVSHLTELFSKTDIAGIKLIIDKQILALTKLK
ncbi:PAS domain S-box protein [Emticicia sp.]|uniref:PAS domain S-box protein n=1 Tax=Emticicia sp. TaxID=1930953 RepID=UPI0037518CE4